MTMITVGCALATLGLTLIDLGTAFRAAAFARQLAALFLGLYGLLALVCIIEKSTTCEVLGLAANLASFILGRLSLALHLGELLKGPLLVQVLPQALMTIIAFISFGLQTAAVGRLYDSGLEAAVVLDLLLLSSFAAWLLFVMIRDILLPPISPLSPTERQLLPEYYRLEMISSLPQDFEKKGCLLAATLFWLGTASLDYFQATHGRDFSDLIVAASHQPLWLAGIAASLLGFLMLAVADRAHEAMSHGRPARKTWRKSRSPVWPNESARKPAKLDIEPFDDHPYSTSTPLSSPTVSEQLLKSIEEDFGAMRSPTILVYSPEEVAALIDLNSSPDSSPTLSSAATLGHPIHSPSTVTSFPETPLPGDDLTTFIAALPTRRSPPASSPPTSPLPSIPEEEEGSHYFSAVPIKPSPVETKRSSAIYHRPTQSAGTVSPKEVAALGILM